LAPRYIVRVGHLHYFSKDTALAVLQETGFRIVGHRYTPSGIERPKSTRSRIAALPRRLAFKINPDLAVRVLGGYSLLVLVSPEKVKTESGQPPTAELLD